MVMRFCRDCANFEDRRDIDDAALCAKNMGPYVCCEDFEPNHESVNTDRLYIRFCVECSNFEDVNGIPLCNENHIPSVACDEFKNRFEKFTGVQQNNRMKNVLVAHIATYYNPKPVPDSIMKIGKKLKW